MRAYASAVIVGFNVKASGPEAIARSLSGGNLQKFIVGREMLQGPRAMIAAQPTWGVDAGAAAVIRQALLDLAAGGAAILVTSQDLDELVEITDRIAVMFHGRLSEPLATADACREKLGLLMGGSSLAEKETVHAVSA
jgi:simple sugar transport system ATP-binding protein